MDTVKDNNLVTSTTKLRQQAEDLLKSRLSDASNLQSDCDVHRLLHELQVHQIELEMQNEELKLSNANLRDSEERYQSLVNTGTYFINRNLPGGILTYVNSALANFTGVDAQTLLGKSYYPFVHEDDLKALVPLLESITIDNPNVEMDTRTILYDGKVCWTNWIISGVFDDQGNFVEYQAVGREITGQKQVELALKASKAMYKAVVEDQMEIIARYLPDGRYTFVNDLFCRLFGKSVDELVGNYWFPDAHPDDIKLIEESLQSMSPEQPVVQIENRVFTATGEIRWLQFVNRGFYSSSGQLMETQVVGRDITDRKRAESSLQDSEHRYRQLLDMVSDAVLVLDTGSNRFLELNRAAAEQYGYTTEEFLNLSSNNISSEPEITKQSIRSAETSVPIRWHRKKDGTVFPVEIRGNLYDFQGCEVYVAVIRDITTRKNAEDNLILYTRRLIEAEENLRKTVATELHDEICGELTALGLNMTLLRSYHKKGNSHDFLARVTDTEKLIDSVRRTTRNIMSNLRPAALDDLDLISALSQHCSTYAFRTGITVIQDFGPDFPRLSTDQELVVFRVVQEALVNITKHAATDTVKISLRKEARTVRLSITDNGQGFDCTLIMEGLSLGSSLGLSTMRNRAHRFEYNAEQSSNDWRHISA